MDAPRPILRLDPDVVNRIAAGEVVQRPASALKELLENALDAGATTIAVTVREGGTKLLQVTDNGCGVAAADLPLLCARHATSKLTSYAQLESGGVATYGFRGEALASVSYVAHVTVTTATAGSPHGWRAAYRDGALVGDPEPCAAPGHGTTVCVEDLFYNTPSRRRGLSSPADEYARCVDVVARYAVGRPTAGFSIRKQGAARPDVVTTGSGGGPGSGGGRDAGLGSAAAATTASAAAVRCVYGQALAKALVPLSFGSEAPPPPGEGGVPPALDAPSFTGRGLISAPAHSGRRPVFILFINGRAVEAGLLRRSLEATYAACAPRGTRPWAFLDLRLPASHVDPNVHPTKREVAFLHGDAVAAALSAAVEAALTAADSAHTYRQATLPGAAPRAPAVADADAATAGAPPPSTTHHPPPVAPQKLVRTDARAQTLHRFVHVGSGSGSGADAAAKAAAAAAAVGAPARPRGRPPTRPPLEAAPGAGAPGPPPPPPGAPRPRPNPHPSTRLASVARLLEACEGPGATHAGLASAIRGAVWVGPVDGTRALLQSGTALHLADLASLSRELAYQQALRRVDAHGHGAVSLDPPLALSELVEIALRDEEAGRGGSGGGDGGGDTPPATPPNIPEAAALAARLLTLKAAPLADHFAFSITPAGALAAVPRVIDGLWPGAGRLPSLALALARDVDWSCEAGFFEGVARALADFNAFGPGVAPPLLGGGEEDDDARAAAGGSPAHHHGDAGLDALGPAGRAWVGEHVLLPALRAHLAPSRALAAGGAVVELTTLERLYRVFERC